MNIGFLLRASRRYVFIHPLQFVLAILGIAMGVAVVIAIDLAGTSAEKAFVATTDIFTGKVSHKIEGSKRRIDEQQYVVLKKKFPHVKMTPVIETRVKRVKITKQISEESNTALNTKSLSAEYFRIFAIDPFSDYSFRNFSVDANTINNGSSFGSLLSTPNSVLISKQTANKYELKLRSEFSVNVNGGDKVLVVVGIMDVNESSLATALNDVLLMDISVAQDVLDSQGYLSRIELFTEDDRLLSELRFSLFVGNHLIAIDNPANALSQMTSAFRTNLQAMSLLAVLVGMFLIYNTMTFSVLQRRDTFATLRAIGVTHREIFSMVFVEACVIALIGTILGLLLGMLLGKGLLILVVRTINDLYFDLNLSQLTISPMSLLKGLSLGIGATLISAWLPLREAFKTSPRENLIRSQLEKKRKSVAPRLAIIGSLLIVVSLLLLFLVNSSLLLSFFCLFLLFIGYALLTPLMVIKIIQFVRPIVAARLGKIVVMSLSNVVNSLSRTGVAMTALTLAVATTIGVTTMVGSFRYAVQDWLNASLKEDVYMSLSVNAIDNANFKPARITHLLQNHTDVEDISIRLWTKVQSELGKKSILIQGIPEYGFEKYIFLGDTHLATFDNYENKDSILITEPLANKHQLKVGQRLKLMTDKGDVSFRIAAVYRDYSTDQGVISMSRNVYSRYWLDPSISSYGVYLKANRSVDAFISDWDTIIKSQQLNKTGPIELVSNSSILEKSLNVFDQTFAITNVLRILTIIVAFVGIFSAFMALQLERSAEFATLRVIGLTPQQLWSSMIIETTAMGCIAGFLAIPLGLLLSAILIMVINVQSFGWSMSINVESADLFSALLFSMLAALLAGLYPSFKMSRQSPAKLLRNG